MKKIFLLKILLAFQTLALSQQNSIDGRISSTIASLDFTNIIVTLKGNDFQKKSIRVDSIGNFTFKDLIPGYYNITVSCTGHQEKLLDSILVQAFQAASLRITFPDPCVFTYPGNSKPGCIGGHTNKIIPIVYGYPGKKAIEQAKRGLIHLAGCLYSDCAPHYYCKIHKLEL